MVQCSLGSEPKSGLPAYVWLTWDLFLTFLSVRFPRLGNVFGLVIPTELVSIDDFCSTEPVVPPPPALEDWVGALARDPVKLAVVGNYLGATFRSWVWEQSCQCVAPPAGTCSSIAIPWTALTDHGVPAENRVIVLRGTALAANTVVYGADVYVHDTPTIGRLLLWNQATTTILRSKNVSPIGAGKLRILFDTTYTMASGESCYWAFEADPSNHYYGWGTNAAPPSDGVLSYASYLENSDYSVSFSWGARTYKGPLMPLACVGGPPPGTEGDTYTPIDPEDPTEIPDPPTAGICNSLEDVCATINLALAAIANLDRKVQWTANRTAPFFWEPGPASTGLTGSGTIAAVGALGALVQVTIPSTMGWTSETPRRTIPAYGTLQFSVDGVPEDATFLHYEDQHVFGAPVATDEIVYNFKPGVVGTVVPLFPVAV